MHIFSGPIYSRGLKVLQVIYEIFNCDLTQGQFLQVFMKALTVTEHNGTFIGYFEKALTVIEQ